MIEHLPPFALKAKAGPRKVPPALTYLIHGVLGYDIEAAQEAVDVHENDGDRPE